MGGGVRPKRAMPESCQLAHEIASARHASGSHAKALHLRSCSVPTHRHGVCDTHRMVSLVENHNLCLRGSSSRGLVRPSNAIVRTPSAWRFKGDCRRTISGWSAHALSSIIVCSSVPRVGGLVARYLPRLVRLSGRASPVLQPPLMSSDLARFASFARHVICRGAAQHLPGNVQPRLR